MARTGQLPSNAPGIAGFYDTSDYQEALITRPRDLQDNATPSGNAMAVIALLKPAGSTNELRTIDVAHQALAQMQTPTGGGMVTQYPLGFGRWLQALSYVVSKPREMPIIGDLDAAGTQALQSVVRDGYRPLQVVALGAPDREDVQVAQPRQLPSNAARAVGSIAPVPLLQDRVLVDGQAEAHVCDAPGTGHAFACQAWAATPEGLRAQVES